MAATRSGRWTAPHTKNGISVEKVIGTGWQVGGVADYTGDGKADIFWRNTGSGVNTLWRMDGTTRIGTRSLPDETDLDWQPAAPVLGLWEG